MKKKLTIVVLLFVMIMMAFTFVACDSNKMSLGFMTSIDEKAKFVKVNVTGYEGKSLKEFLENEDTLGAVIENGWKLVEINGLKPQESEFICIFTSDESKKNTWEGAREPIVNKGVTYYESGVGISDLVVSKDIKYMFVIVNWTI